MKVLQVHNNKLDRGGVQTIIMHAAKNMPELHFDFLTFNSEKGSLEKHFVELGGRIFNISHSEGSNVFRKLIDKYCRIFRIFFKTLTVIKKYGPYDVIHCHNELESGICTLAALLSGVSIRIVHAHTNPKNRLKANNFLKSFYRRALRRITLVTSNVKIGCSKEAFISLFGKKFVDKHNYYIIPNPIDLTKFEKRDSNRYKKEDNIVHVGKFSNVKNQVFLIKLLPLLLMYNKNIKLFLVGSGDNYYNILKRTAFEYGVDKYVFFLPANTDIKSILSKASIFIFPSKSEGLGIVLLEAQAMEVPCLVSDSVPKEIDCGLCTFLSLERPLEDWAETTVNILNNNHFKKLNKAKLRNFDVEVFINKLRSVYKTPLEHNQNHKLDFEMTSSKNRKYQRSQDS